MLRVKADALSYQTTSIPEPRQVRYGSFQCTDEVFDAWRTTLDAAQALEAIAVVFQCPASFSPRATHIRNLRGFFRTIARDAGCIRLCWEPRGEWRRETVLELCEESGLALVLDPFHDAPRFQWLLERWEKS